MRLLLLALLAAPSGLLAAEKGPAFPIKVASVTGGRLLGGGRTLEPGDALPKRGVVLLTAGQAVLDAGAAGSLLLKGPASFHPAPDGGELRTGGLLGVLPRLKGEFRLRAGPVTAAVRGTNLFVERRDQDTYLCLCRGAVEVSGEGKGKRFRKRIETSKGKEHIAHLFTPREDGGVDAAPAGLEGHGDMQIKRLLMR